MEAGYRNPGDLEGIEDPKGNERVEMGRSFLDLAKREAFERLEREKRGFVEAAKRRVDPQHDPDSRPMSQVAQVLDDLSGAIDALQHRMEMLHERLSPVLGEGPEQRIPHQDEDAIAVSSPLGESLRYRCDDLRGMVRTLDSLVARLEV